MSQIIINRETCNQCGQCVYTCTKEVIDLESPESATLDNCSLCGHCVAVCPTGAFEHAAMQDTRFGAVESTVSADDFAAFNASCRSIRRYKNQSLEKEEIEQLLQAAADAPQAKNSRRQGYAVVTDREKIREMDRAVVGSYRKLLKLLSPPVRFLIRLLKPSLGKELNKNLPSLRRLVQRGEDGKYPIFHDAPCVIIIHGPAGNMLGRDDAAIAERSMLLQAHAMGLGGCIIGYASVRSKALKKFIRIPAGDVIQTVAVFGHPETKFRKVIHRPVINVRWY